MLCRRNVCVSGISTDVNGRRPSDRGATVVEYGLVIAVIAVVAMAAVSFLGSRTSASMSSAGAALDLSSLRAAPAAPLAATGAPAGPVDVTAPVTAPADVIPATVVDTGTAADAGAVGAEAVAAAMATEPRPPEPATSTEAAASAGAVDAAGTAENPADIAATSLLAGDWKQVAGAKGTATLSGTTIVTTPGSAAIVMNAAAWSGPDMTVSTTAQLVRPDPKTIDGGYALWVRATTNKYGQIESGYTFQVDPGLGSKFALRVWNNQKQSAPLALVSFPVGFNPEIAAVVSVSVIGDRLVATVNGSIIVTVDSLSAAVAKQPPLIINGTTYVTTWTPPVGTDYGLRTWGSTGISASSTTIR